MSDPILPKHFNERQVSSNVTIENPEREIKLSFFQEYKEGRHDF
jgi:hypothetical protein